MLRHLEEALRFYPLKKAFLVGVSGGRDSMALLHALVESGRRHLIVCHLDHRLRGRESRADAALVRRTAGKLGLAFEGARADTKKFAKVNGLSLEHAARELRHAFFTECSRKHRCRRVILAHHADDQVETCLFNFLRGAGAAGLAGMRPVTRIGKLEVIRPLLGVTRKEIDAFVKTHRIAFRDDATNSDTTPSRNRIRHGIVPAIRHAFGDSFRSAILRASEILRMEDDWLEGQVPATPRRLSCASLRAIAPALQHRMVLKWLRQNRVPDPGLVETRRVLSLLDVENGPAKINLPGSLHARRRGGEIFLEKAKG